jgi:hypothetical protein
MAIPVRSIPVLEGEVAERFEKNARWAEKHRGSIKFTKEERESFNKSMKEYYQTYGTR